MAVWYETTPGGMRIRCTDEDARPEDRELLIAQKRDEISWLQEAAGRMRIALDKQPDNLGPQSDQTALRILAILEQQLACLKSL